MTRQQFALDESALEQASAADYAAAVVGAVGATQLASPSPPEIHVVEEFAFGTVVDDVTATDTYALVTLADNAATAICDDPSVSTCSVSVSASVETSETRRMRRRIAAVWRRLDGHGASGSLISFTVVRTVLNASAYGSVPTVQSRMDSFVGDSPSVIGLNSTRRVGLSVEVLTIQQSSPSDGVGDAQGAVDDVNATSESIAALVSSSIGFPVAAAIAVTFPPHPPPPWLPPSPSPPPIPPQPQAPPPPPRPPENPPSPPPPLTPPFMPPPMIPPAIPPLAPGQRYGTSKLWFTITIALPYAGILHPEEFWHRKLNELAEIVGNETTIQMSVEVWRHPDDQIVEAPESMAGLSAHFNSTVMRSTVQQILEVIDAPTPPSVPPMPPPDPATPDGASQTFLEAGQGVLEAGRVAACPTGEQNVGDECFPCQQGAYCVGGQPFPCEAGTWHEITGSNSSADCISCPSTGSRCSGASVTLEPGFFMWTKYDAKSFACAQTRACLGGTQFGNESCAEGHTGVLCGRCIDNYYRGRWNCLPCEMVGADDKMDSGVGMAIFLPLAAIIGILLILLYLRALDPPVEMANAFGKRVSTFGCGRWLVGRYRRMWQLLLPLLPIASGLFKTFLSYSQCLSAIRRFEEVVWPQMFVEFMAKFEILDLELFSMVPAECLGKQRLGFPMELYATLAFPILVFLVPFLLLWCFALFRQLVSGKCFCFAGFCRLVGGCFRCIRGVIVGTWRCIFCCCLPQRFRPKREVAPATKPKSKKNKPTQGVIAAACSTACEQYTHSRSFKLTTLGLLLVYPTISRKCLSAFSCVPAVTEDGVSTFFMREDPVIVCFEGEWYGLATASILGLVIYCFGLPVLAIGLILRARAIMRRRYVSDADKTEARERVSLLTSSYEPGYWYMESVWLAHKFFFTGVIHLFAFDASLQIYVGTLVALVSFLGALLTKPYKYDICDFVQNVVLLQLLFTYITVRADAPTCRVPLSSRASPRLIEPFLCCSRRISRTPRALRPACC